MLSKQTEWAQIGSVLRRGEARGEEGGGRAIMCLIALTEGLRQA